MRDKKFVASTKLFRKIPPIVLIAFIIQLGFFIIYRKSEGITNFTNIESIIKTFLIIVMIFWITSIVFSRWRKISSIINIILLYFYIFLLLYHYHTRISLDFSIIWNYKKELFYSEVLQMIYNTIGTNTILFLIVFSISIVICQIKWKLFYKPISSKINILQLVVITAFFWFVYITPVQSYDEMTSFYQSVKNWYRIHYVFSNYTFNDIPLYPYVNYVDTTDEIINNKELPNIFIIAVESFNSHFVEKKTFTGKKVTPFFDSLISKGIYIEHFYSNSIETDRGHLSMLFSILPSFRGAVFENFSSLNLKSLPQILQEFNYRTIFYQGANSLNFQNEGPFLAKHGFEVCRSAKSKLKKDVANWGNPTKGYGGCNDNVLYRQFFETFDSLYYNEKDKGKKYFCFLATITSHMPWIRQKYDPNLPYPHADKIEEDYSNIMFRVDCYLKIFFKELKKRKCLKNSIVIITGDHSYPVNEHGGILNAVNLYDENCKMPFLMLWEDKLQPKRIQENAWSQIDIAPSILDLLKIRVTNHFTGKSFFNNKLRRGNVVHLIQPYSGLFFAVIIYPYKYIINIMSDEESVFNLFNDPGEKYNIIEKFEERKLFILKKQIKQFALNQYLIENNRIWSDSLIKITK